ncbi:MAG: hypothetical protein DK306_001917 [Chloroflexi bacterium]|nr:MAG: hypothetical protein DK306_001917 [Chloroflexota bacterium]
MRGRAVVIREEATGASGRWASRPGTLADGALATVVGAVLVLALGLGGGLFASGPSDRDVHSAYTAGLAVGADTALAVQRAQQDAATQATAAAALAGPPDLALSPDALRAWLAARRAREDPRYEALHYPEDFPANWNFGVPPQATKDVRTATGQASLSPTRIGPPITGDGRLTCDATRCTDVTSGFSIPLLIIRGWFDPTRFISDPPAAIGALIGQAASTGPARLSCGLEIFAETLIVPIDCPRDLD